MGLYGSWMTGPCRVRLVIGVFIDLWERQHRANTWSEEEEEEEGNYYVLKLKCSSESSPHCQYAKVVRFDLIWCIGALLAAIRRKLRGSCLEGQLPMYWDWETTSYGTKLVHFRIDLNVLPRWQVRTTAKKLLHLKSFALLRTLLCSTRCTGFVPQRDLGVRLVSYDCGNLTYLERLYVGHNNRLVYVRSLPAEGGFRVSRKMKRLAAWERLGLLIATHIERMHINL